MSSQDQALPNSFGMAQSSGPWDSTANYTRDEYRSSQGYQVTYNAGLYNLVGNPTVGTPPGVDSAWVLIADIGGVGGGIQSINGNTVTAQVIAGSGFVSVNSISGTTTISTNPAQSITVSGITVNGAGGYTGSVTSPTFIGALTGTASGNTTYTANNHGVVLSSATNAMTVVAPVSNTGYVLTSNGLSADPTWQPVSGSGGVTSMGTFSTSGTDVTGASISGSVLTLQAASSLAPGCVSTIAQVFAGAKTFTSAPILSSLTASLPLQLDSSKNIVSAAINLASQVTGELANVHTSCESTNNPNTIVNRDGSGNFAAGTITASLSGVASGNTTYAANNHGVVVSSATNAMTVIAPVSQTNYVLTSNGTSANPTWQAPALGITSVNADATATQVITGSGIISANTVSGTTTISANTSNLAIYQGLTTLPLTDASGASLAFTGVVGNYTKSGDQVNVGGVLTYPTTANGSNAAINCLPAASVVNQTVAVFAAGITGGLTGVIGVGTSIMFLFHNSTGLAALNSELSNFQLVFGFTCSV